MTVSNNSIVRMTCPNPNCNKVLKTTEAAHDRPAACPNCRTKFIVKGTPPLPEKLPVVIPTRGMAAPAPVTRPRQPSVAPARLPAVIPNRPQAAPAPVARSRQQPVATRHERSQKTVAAKFKLPGQLGEFGTEVSQETANDTCKVMSGGFLVAIGVFLASIILGKKIGPA